MDGIKKKEHDEESPPPPPSLLLERAKRITPLLQPFIGKALMH